MNQINLARERNAIHESPTLQRLDQSKPNLLAIGAVIIYFMVFICLNIVHFNDEEISTSDTITLIVRVDERDNFNTSESNVTSDSKLIHFKMHVPNITSDDETNLNTSEPNIISGVVKPVTGGFTFEYRPQYDKTILATIHGIDAYLERGGSTYRVDPQYTLLCRLNISKDCFTKYIAENLDRVVAFSPLYAKHQADQGMLYELHDNFNSLLLSLGIRTQVLEAINPDKKQVYMRTRPNNEPWEIQITVTDDFYYRENLLNVAARKTLDLFDYMIWIDAHQVFENTYWWEEAIYHMAHESAVHFAERVNYYDYKNQTVWIGLPTVTYFYKYTNTVRGFAYFAGNAWGMRKEVYMDIGHIIDECIAGACDYSLVISLMKSNDDWDGISQFPNYWNQLRPIIEEHRAKMKGKVKTIRGVLYHIEHPHLFNYFTIQKSFSNCCFDVVTDLMRDENFTLHSTNPTFKAEFDT